MKFLVVLFLLSFKTNIIYSEDILSPEEIIKIMTDSKFRYNIETLNDSIEYNFSNNLTTNHVYQDKSDKNIKLLFSELSDDEKVIFEKAENNFQHNMYYQARQYYKELISKNEKLYFINTYIGQSFEAEKKYDDAEDWYRLSINKNYIDYMAHWFLADILILKNQKKEALNEIILAHLLNRNNPRIIKSMKRIFSKNDYSFDEFVFNPQYKIDSISSTEYNIKFKNSTWMFYAMTKALRQYEPNYNGSKQKINLDVINLEKEALLGLIILYKKRIEDKNNAENDNKEDIEDEFNNLNIEAVKVTEAFDNNLLGEFILYEIILPNYPNIILTFDDKMIANLVDYFLKNKIKEFD